MYNWSHSGKLVKRIGTFCEIIHQDIELLFVPVKRAIIQAIQYAKHSAMQVKSFHCSSTIFCIPEGQCNSGLSSDPSSQFGIPSHAL